MAEVVATTHNANKPRNAATTVAFGYDVAIRLGRAQLNINRLIAHLGLCDEVGQTEISIRTRYEVGAMLIEQSVLHALGHAAQHADNQFAAFTTHGIERLQAVNNLLFRIVAYRASIEEHGISLVQ